MDKNLTAYCGLCCADCIPSRHDFFGVIDKFDQMLKELQFEKYAELKSVLHGEFTNYRTFLSVLHRIKDLRCPNPCKEGGGKTDCVVRQCTKRKMVNGCWECEDRSKCSLLNDLRQVHPHLDHHLDLIAEMGTDRWFEKRKEHYFWQCHPDLQHS